MTVDKSTMKFIIKDRNVRVENDDSYTDEEIHGLITQSMIVCIMARLDRFLKLVRRHMAGMKDSGSYVPKLADHKRMLREFTTPHLLRMAIVARFASSTHRSGLTSARSANHVSDIDAFKYNSYVATAQHAQFPSRPWMDAAHVANHMGVPTANFATFNTPANAVQTAVRQAAEATRNATAGQADAQRESKLLLRPLRMLSMEMNTSVALHPVDTTLVLLEGIF